jgi:hypothetical protein
VPAIGPDADKPIKVIKEVDEGRNNKSIKSSIQWYDLETEYED